MANLYCHFAFLEFSVGVRGFDKGLSQISSFFFSSQYVRRVNLTSFHYDIIIDAFTLL